LYGKSLFLKGLARLSMKELKNTRASKVIPKRKQKARIMVFAPDATDGILAGSFTFDHELGHVLSPNPFRVRFRTGGSSAEFHANLEVAKNKIECIADAFATIRNLQRSGLDNPDIARRAVYRSWEAVQADDRSHLSTPIIAQIWADRHKVDFLSLSPQETWQKALEYAEKNTPGKDDLRLMEKEFSLEPLVPKDHFSKNRGSYQVSMLQVLELLATTCLTTANANVFLVGSAIVVADVASTRPLLTDPDWMKVVDKMQERAVQLGMKDKMEMFRQNTASITKWDDPSLEKHTDLFAMEKQRAAIARLLKL
jgi:hypothetical protein